MGVYRRHGEHQWCRCVSEGSRAPRHGNSCWAVPPLSASYRASQLSGSEAKDPRPKEVKQPAPSLAKRTRLAAGEAGKAGSRPEQGAARGTFPLSTLRAATSQANRTHAARRGGGGSRRAWTRHAALALATAPGRHAGLSAGRGNWNCTWPSSWSQHLDRSTWTSTWTQCPVAAAAAGPCTLPSSLCRSTFSAPGRPYCQTAELS